MELASWIFLVLQNFSDIFYLVLQYNAWDIFYYTYLFLCPVIILSLEDR